MKVLHHYHKSMKLVNKQYAISLKTKLNYKILYQSDSCKNTYAWKSLKWSTFRQLNEALSKWFLQKRSEGMPISGLMGAKQAGIFHKHLTIKEPFKVSSGWLHRFKKCWGIRELTIQSENLCRWRRNGGILQWAGDDNYRKESTTISNL